ncbi:hypothetical protein FRX31_020406 [Thalictrum thalictroides]|uniref:Uncharacterized protein n=1 Tax=Thalictrum thalictroides TaxID=46969 RepID=A0A7J6VZ86_THATH|nr:hypothetical protein FRX31_020406 [Thalictrum thalictroides]
MGFITANGIGGGASSSSSSNKKWVLLFLMVVVRTSYFCYNCYYRDRLSGCLGDDCEDCICW